ncbi:Uncharacterised protein [Bordetella pertussis]|nr:Uncharacterised protein [Bordetella pertussis]
MSAIRPGLLCVVTNVHLRQKHGQASGKNHPEQLEHSCPINISRFPLGAKKSRSTPITR